MMLVFQQKFANFVLSYLEERKSFQAYTRIPIYVYENIYFKNRIGRHIYFNKYAELRFNSI